MTDTLLAKWAKDKLSGARIATIEEDRTHSISIVLTSGDVLNVTASPFSELELDVQLIERAR